MMVVESLLRPCCYRVVAAAGFAVAICLPAGNAGAEDWPQFRGPNASGVSQSKLSLPTEISPDAPVLWKATVPPGHSSPVLFGDRIYLTGVHDKLLKTLAFDRRTGARLWERDAPYETLEATHRTGSFAQSSPATDGEIVVSFFGSSGLHAWDRDGQPLWSHRMGPFKNDFGAGSSPIIVDDLVILVQDHDLDSFIAAFDKRTGKEVWRKDRADFLRNYATPVIWEHDDRKEIVVAATLRIVGYDLATGAENWTVTGVSRIVNMTPVIGPDNTLYAACWSPGGEDNERVDPPPVEELFTRDADKNGTIEQSEFPDGPLQRRFNQIDRNKDGHITPEEYSFVRQVLSGGRNVVLAIKPGGRGDITRSHVAWEYTRQIPYCPSPLYYQGVLYLIKDGGILTTLDPANGRILKQSRIQATGKYYASPVGGDGKVYLLSEDGDVTVITAEAQWKVLHTASFKADGHGTPALADGRIYVRIGEQLLSFGNPIQAAGLE